MANNSQTPSNQTINGCYSSQECIQGICDLSDAVNGEAGNCNCWVGWLGEHCDQNLQSILPGIFFSWKMIMIFLNLILFFVSFREVFRPRTKVINLL